MRCLLLLAWPCTWLVRGRGGGYLAYPMSCTGKCSKALWEPRSEEDVRRRKCVVCIERSGEKRLLGPSLSTHVVGSSEVAADQRSSCLSLQTSHCLPTQPPCHSLLGPTVSAHGLLILPTIGVVAGQKRRKGGQGRRENANRNLARKESKEAGSGSQRRKGQPQPGTAGPLTSAEPT
jgi:hypothetical protein